MALQPGSTLGPYEVLALIGAGGMGEVYRARDPRLNRDVAIKVLPADRVGDDSRRRRFVQEAHAASALNDPHIITIHEIESANGIDFIVMEYVRGKSLDALIPRHGMRLGEVLRIAIAVADALAAAHARGIIHRDLKPANVMVGADGPVKVLDFGLAKLSGSDGADEASPTHTADVALSAPGTIAGTAAYMAPEQASGGRVDARSDIFSFGALLYEMVTGVCAFAGATTVDTLSAVLQTQPKPPTAIVPGVPIDLEKVILRCLRKDPERRFQHMGDVKVALQEIKEDSDSGTGVATPRAAERRGRFIVALVGTVAVLGGLAAWLVWSRQQTDVPPLRVVPLTTLKGVEDDPTFSPDGEQVAFAWNGETEDNYDIYVTLIGSSEVRRLTNDPGNDFYPRWSPDGRQIAFVRQGLDGTTIQLVSPLGGAARRLSNIRAGSISRSPDGRWLAAGAFVELEGTNPPPSTVYVIPIQGGEPRPLLSSKAPAYDREPAFSPDGQRLVYVSCSGAGTGGWLGGCHVYVVELDATVTPRAPPRRLTTQGTLGMGGITWTRDGESVVYVAYVEGFSPSLWRVGSEGTRPPERIEVAGLRATAPATTPSSDRLAFARMAYDLDIYRFEADRPARWVVGSTAMEGDVRVSADGRRLAFLSERSGTAEIWLAAADGSGSQQLTHGPGSMQGSPSWSPDGRRIAFDSFTDDNRWHVWVIDVDGGTPRRLTTEPGDQNVPTWSRDGRWIYFSADHGTGRDIWRVPSSGGPAERMTRGGSGHFACESPDGKSLLFQPEEGDSPLMAIPLTGGEARQLVACVSLSAFGAGPQGVYYVPCDPTSNPVVHVLDPETGRDRPLGQLEKFEGRPLGLAVSPDGKTIFYSKRVSDGADLMLIENFR